MIKVQELKDDAIVSIKVNKSYYFMVKNLAYALTQKLIDESNDPQHIKDCFEKQYHELNENQRNFHTIALMIAEIELQAKNQDLIMDKEILEPGDEGYVAPTED